MAALIQDLESKAPKNKVGYKEGPPFCQACDYFISPAACEIVQGPIHKVGTCTLWFEKGKVNAN